MANNYYTEYKQTPKYDYSNLDVSVYDFDDTLSKLLQAQMYKQYMNIDSSKITHEEQDNKESEEKEDTTTKKQDSWFSDNLKPIYINKQDYSINFTEPSPIALKAAEIAENATSFYSNSAKGYLPLGKLGKDPGGKCTSGPETFYRKAGLELASLWWNTGNPHTATDTKLREKGFKLVWHGTAQQAKNKDYKDILKPGDLIVNYGNYSSSNKNHPNGPSGHWAIWTGTQWISDLKQGTEGFVYGTRGRLGDHSAEIYRLSNG